MTKGCRKADNLALMGPKFCSKSSTTSFSLPKIIIIKKKQEKKFEKRKKKKRKGKKRIDRERE